MIDRFTRHIRLSRRTRYWFLQPATLIFGLILSGTALATQPLQHYERYSSKSIDEVLEDAEFAISERNFRITDRLHIGKAIRERENINFPDYEVILFCNLTHARQVLELEPGFINFCPFKVTFRRVADNILIAAPLLAEESDNTAVDTIAVRVNKLIREIVDFSAEQWFVGEE